MVLNYAHLTVTGMEVASCIAETALSLSTVDLVEVPFQAVLGEDIGLALQKVCTNMFLTSTNVKFSVYVGCYYD